MLNKRVREQRTSFGVVKEKELIAGGGWTGRVPWSALVRIDARFASKSLEDSSVTEINFIGAGGSGQINEKVI